MAGLCVCMCIVWCRLGIWLCVSITNLTNCFGPQWLEKCQVGNEEVSVGTENQYSDFIKNSNA